MRKELAVLVAAAMMLVIAVSPAWAVPGKGQGVGQGVGGGDIGHLDYGQKTRVGGGPLNNPHNGCDIFC